MFELKDFGMRKSTLLRRLNAYWNPSNVFYQEKEELLKKESFSIEEIEKLSQILFASEEKYVLENRLYFDALKIGWSMRAYHSFLQSQAQIFLYKRSDWNSYDSTTFPDQKGYIHGYELAKIFPDLPYDRFDRIANRSTRIMQVLGDYSQKEEWIKGFIRGSRDYLREKDVDP